MPVVSFIHHIRCLLQGSGSEGRPDSPSDSLDGTKKGERKKEFVCQVGLPLQHFTVLNFELKQQTLNLNVGKILL